MCWFVLSVQVVGMIGKLDEEQGEAVLGLVWCFYMPA